MSSGSQNLNSNCKSKQLESEKKKAKWKAREEPPIMSYSRFGCLNHGPPLAALVKDNITTLILTLANSKYLNAIIHVFRMQDIVVPMLRKMIDLLIHASQCRSPHFQCWPHICSFPITKKEDASDDSEDDSDDSDVYFRFFRGIRCTDIYTFCQIHVKLMAEF
ncbi:hypothetical protein Tco_0001525 [Tanacetum coccineum]